MKLTLITEYWGERGGAENYLWNIGHFLAPGSLTVIAPRSGHSKLPIGSGINNISIQRLRWPLLWPSWLPLFLHLYRQARQGELDVLLCGKTLFEGHLGYFLKKYAGVPYIVFTYGMEIEYWNQHRRSFKKMLKVLRRADLIIYINEVTKKKLIEFGIAQDQIIKIQPGVTARHLNKTSRPMIESRLRYYNIKQPYVLAVGRLIARKGFDVLIEAFAGLDQTIFSQHRLVIIGDGPDLRHLQSVAERNFIGTSITFLTKVPDKDLPSLYAGAEIFALTPCEISGELEGFGIVYLEAAAHGIPAIGTKTGGVPEAVLDNKTGLIIMPADTSGLTRALKRLLVDAELRANFGLAGQQRVLKQFQWETKSAQLQTAIEKILAHTQSY